MKNLSLTLAGLLVLSTVIPDLYSSSAWADSTPFKVGIILPLSGPLADMGQASRKGFELFESQNPDCSKSTKIIYEDSQYDGKLSISAFNKLRSSDKVDFTVVWGNTPSGVISEVAERMQAPTLALSMNPDAKGKKFVASFGPKIEMLVDKVVEQFKIWNLKNPAAVSIDIGNALVGVEMVKKKLDGNLIVKTISNTETDFKLIIAGLKNQGVDGLLFFALPGQALTFIKQARDLDFRPKIIGGDVFAEDAFTEEVIKIKADVSYVYGSVTDQFISKLKDHYHGTTYFFETAMGYTVAKLMCELGNRKTDNQKFDAIKELSTLNLKDAPINGLRLLNDESYGLHFENDGRVYTITY